MFPKQFMIGNNLVFSGKVDNQTYTYQFILLSSTNRIVIDPVLTGDLLEVDVPSTETAEYFAGEYHWFLFGTFNGQRYQVCDGYTNFTDDVGVLVSHDASTHAERMLAAIEKRLEGRILTDHENYSIDGRSLSRIPFEQLATLRNKYAWKVRDQKVKKGILKRHRRIRHR